MILEHLENEKIVKAVSNAIIFIRNTTFESNNEIQSLLTKKELIDNMVMLTGGFNERFAHIIKSTSKYDFLNYREIDKAIKEKLSSFNNPKEDIRVRDVVEAVRNIEIIEMRLGFKPREIYNLTYDIDKKNYNNEIKYNYIY